MARGLDLTGKRFGSLIVLDRTGQSQGGYPLWRCRCDCGNEVIVASRRLRRGTVTSCGCTPKPAAHRGPKAEDLTGRRFGSLIALRQLESRGGRTRWLCQCDCGKLHAAAAHELKTGKVTSCGCRRKIGLRGIADITGRRFGRLVALSPTERRDKKGSVYWLCRCDCGNELEITENSLVYGNYRSCGCLKQDLQREITNRLHRVDGTCVEWLEKRKHRSDNRSGFRGVFLLHTGKYRVSIGFKKQRFYLGVFATFEEAVAARLEAEEKIHNAFVRAYYLWRERSDPLPEEERTPLEFSVEKKGDEFIIISNAELFAPPSEEKAL